MATPGHAPQEGFTDMCPSAVNFMPCMTDEQPYQSSWNGPYYWQQYPTVRYYNLFKEVVVQNPYHTAQSNTNYLYGTYDAFDETNPRDFILRGATNYGPYKPYNWNDVARYTQVTSSPDWYMQPPCNAVDPNPPSRDPSTHPISVGQVCCFIKKCLGQ